MRPPPFSRAEGSYNLPHTALPNGSPSYTYQGNGSTDHSPLLVKCNELSNVAVPPILRSATMFLGPNAVEETSYNATTGNLTVSPLLACVHLYVSRSSPKANIVHHQPNGNEPLGGVQPGHWHASKVKRSYRLFRCNPGLLFCLLGR